MSTRGYSPRSHGRSEHAPIVIDMLDYGNDAEYVEDFSYSYSSPRRTTTPTAAVAAASAAKSGSSRSSTRHASSSVSSPRHKNDMVSSPRYTSNDASVRRSTRSSSRRSSGTPVTSAASNPHQQQLQQLQQQQQQPSPRHQQQPSPRHHQPQQQQQQQQRPSSTRHSSNSSVHSSSTSPRKAVHMHNFAQRRSFMMGASQPTSATDYSSPNPTPRGDGNDDYHQDSNGRVNQQQDREYRQSPGRTRHYQQANEGGDTRDSRPVVDTSSRRRSIESSVSHHHDQRVHDEFADTVPIYSSPSSSRFDGKPQQQHHRQQQLQHHNQSNTETKSTQEAATFPAFANTKRSEKPVFTFEEENDDEEDEDDDVHTVPGVMNRPSPNAEMGAPVPRSSASVAPPASEKKVFYFDIDDLSQRLLNSGDQDFSRRLRKKKAKNARSRISRNRARRQSKKSVFNLELDNDATTGGGGVQSTNSAISVLEGAPNESSIHRDRASRFDSQSVVSGKSGTTGLFIDTSAEIRHATPNVRGSHNTTDEGMKIRRDPSVGSSPAEHTRALSPDITMDVDVESIDERAEVHLSSPREMTPRSSRLEVNNPKIPTIMVDDRSGTASPTQISMAAVPPTVTDMRDDNAGMTDSPARARAGSAEMRVTKVYDQINDRLDHIVTRENDVENRQKAIRAVFEEVQQHVADLRKTKSAGTPKVGDTHQHDDVLDLVSLTDETKRSLTDNGDDQVTQHHNGDDDQITKRLNESSIDVDDLMARLEKVENKQGPSAPTSPVNDVEADHDILYLDLSERLEGEQQDEDENEGMDTFDVGGPGAQSQEARASAYLSSDNSCDDEVVVQKQSTDKGEREVYVIEEEDGKSVASPRSTISPRGSIISARGSTISPRGSIISPRGSIISPRVSDIEKQESYLSNVLIADQADQDQEVGAGPSIESIVSNHKEPEEEQEERLEPDGDRLESIATNEADNSDEGDALAGLGSMSGLRSKSGLGSKSMEGVRQQPGDDVLDTDDDDDAAAMDIDKEFDRVVPLSDDESQSMSVNYDIDETLDRVARQSELDKQEVTKAMSRQEEEEKANALLDTLSNGSLFAEKEALKSQSSASHQASSDPAQPPRQLEELTSYPNVGESTSNLNESFVDIGRKDGDDGHVNNGSLGYDYDLAISAAKSSSSTSASDLEEFPMNVNNQEYAEHSDDDISETSSNVSSDISESSSGSESESSYDSFVSIAESERSGLEFFDEQQGFAENFMSNLVASTFGWFEKQQESLACGFKSSEAEGPSLLRESMTRQKAGEEEANKTIKGLRNAVTSKYGRDGVPATAAVERKHKSSNGKKYRRGNSGAVDDRKRSKRAESSHPKRGNTAGKDECGAGQKASHGKSSEQQGKKKKQNHAAKSEKQLVEDSRKKSLEDQDKKMDATKKESDVAVPRPKSIRIGEAALAAVNGAVSPFAAQSKLKSPKSPTVEEITRQYNFDFLSSDDDDAAGSNSVQVIAVHPESPEEEKARTSENTKKKDLDLECSAKDDVDSVQVITSVSPQNHEEDVQVVSTVDVKLAKAKAKNKAKSKAKSKSKRSNNKLNGGAEVGPLSLPRSEAKAKRAKSPEPEPETAVASLSPPRTKPDRRSDSNPNSNDASIPGTHNVEHSAEKKLAKRVSSKGPHKVSKKSPKAEKKTEKEMAKASKRSASRTRRRRGAEGGGHDDESVSEADSINDELLTEEERENARKERRRVAALKRRRKLRDKRKAKLEESLTDDTFN